MWGPSWLEHLIEVVDLEQVRRVQQGANAPRADLFEEQARPFRAGEKAPEKRLHQDHGVMTFRHGGQFPAGGHHLLPYRFLEMILHAPPVSAAGGAPPR